MGHEATPLDLIHSVLKELAGQVLEEEDHS